MRSYASGARWALLLCSVFCMGANEAPFMGAERCRLCHRSIYDRWTATPHRLATAGLPPENETPSCLTCHATGPAALPGVQCESCHGAGGNYWPADVMIDPGKAREAGLVTPDEAICGRCHGNGPPGHATDFEMPRGAERRRFIH